MWSQPCITAQANGLCQVGQDRIHLLHLPEWLDSRRHQIVPFIHLCTRIITPTVLQVLCKTYLFSHSTFISTVFINGDINPVYYSHLSLSFSPWLSLCLSVCMCLNSSQQAGSISTREGHVQTEDAGSRCHQYPTAEVPRLDCACHRH